MTPNALLPRAIRRFLRSRGYTITRFPPSQQPPLDMRERGNDPRVCAYVGRPVLIDAPLHLGRGLHNYPLNRCGPHPFVRAVAAMLAARTEEPTAQRRIIREVLDAYYRRVQPSTFGEWMGLHARCSPLDVCPWSVPLPWEDRTVAQTRRIRRWVVREESARLGSELTIGAGWQFVGPLTQPKLDLEVERLHCLTLSMTTQGYRRSNGRTGDVSAVVLWRPDATTDRWRWIVHDGHHRAAVASAAGYDRLPLRVIALVRRDESAAWPNVVAGTYTETTALEVFDRIFSDAVPPVARNWISYLEGAGG